MTKTRNTKRALLLSALSLLLCVSMLVGSTFAWFTDSVTSAGNTIQSGTLDVDLVDADNHSMAGQVIKFKTFDNRAQDKILWEPGCTYKTEPVRVVNNGNLALKYRVIINGIVGDAKLLEAIKWTATIGNETFDINVAEGKLDPALGEKESGDIVLTGHMKEEAGNEYQGLTVEGISITVYATQLTAEFDSISNQYDKYASVATYAEMKTALAEGITEFNFMGNEINLNYGLTQAMVPAGSTVTIANAVVSGTSYGNGVNGTVIFENCTFTNTGAYSIHFDNGAGDVVFKNCKLYGWNSFGDALNSVSFYDSALYGNGTYALIRSYADLYIENCTYDISDANHTDAYSEGIEAVGGAKLEMVNSSQVVDSAAGIKDALAADKDVVLKDDVTFTGVAQMPDRGNNVEVYGNKTGFAQYGGVLDGNGNEIIDSEGGSSYVVVTHGGTIKNLKITTGARGIVTYSPTEDVYVDNVVVDGPGYALNSTELGAVNMVVTDSTVNGWTSLAGFASVSFTNCKLGENSTKYWQSFGYSQDYDRLFRVYSPTTYTECEFEQGYYLDLSVGGTATLVDCTVNGVELTADNYANYITIELPADKTLADCVAFN